MGASPGAAVALTADERGDRRPPRAARDPRADAGPAPHRRSLLTVEEGRYVASRIPGATLVELPGDDHLPFVGDQDAMLDAIERFLSADTTRSTPIACSRPS